MKKEIKSITLKNKGAVEQKEASALPRFTPPPPLSIQKLEGTIEAFVTCEICKAEFNGKIIVNVIEKIDGAYTKRVISWTDATNDFYVSEWRDEGDNFYFSEWRERATVSEERFFACRNIRTGVPADPYFFRKHPLIFKELKSNQKFKEILSDSSRDLTGSLLCNIEGAIINNLMCESIRKGKVRCFNCDDFGNDYSSVVLEIMAPTNDEISKFEHFRKHDSVIPSMYWFERDEKLFQYCLHLPIAEPIKEETDIHEGKPNATAATMSKPCAVCGWIHTDDFTKWTDPNSGKTHRLGPTTKGRLLLEKLHAAMIKDGGDTAITNFIADADLKNGNSVSQILNDLHPVLYFSTTSNFGRIRRPGEIKPKGRPKTK